MKKASVPKLDIVRDYEITGGNPIWKYPLHWHTFYEIEWVTEGRSVQTVNGYCYRQEPGLLSIMTPNDFHQIESDGSITYKKIAFSEGFVSPEITNMLKSREHPCMIQVPTDRYKDFSGYFEILDRYASGDDRLSKRIVKNITEVICIEAVTLEETLGSGRESTAVRAFLRDDDLCRLSRFVEENFRSRIRLQDAAGIVCQSEGYFSHYFKNRFGLTFSEYVKRYRLKYAANLLISSGKSIAEVSFDSGFTSVTFFNRAFKEFYGMTPSSYRKEKISE